MEPRHLTDEQLQDYLDGNLNKGDLLVRDHLKSCKKCKDQFAQYTSLYSVFKTAEKVMLSAQFSENILSRVAGQPAPAIAFKGLPLMLAAFGFVIGLGVAVYFTGMARIMSLLYNIIDFGKIFLPPLAGISAYLNEMHLNPGLLGLAAVALVLMLFLDHYVLQRQKIISIFK